MAGDALKKLLCSVGQVFLDRAEDRTPGLRIDPDQASKESEMSVRLHIAKNTSRVRLDAGT